MYIITRQTIHNLQPPKTYHRFGLEFLELPAGLGISSEDLSLRVYTMDKPSVSNEKTTVEQRGFKVHFSGKDNFSGEWTVALYDTIDDLTKASLWAWKEMACSLRTGASVNPNIYKARCLATDLSYDNSEISFYDMHGIFPSNIQYSAGWGTDVGAQVMNITFSYDYWSNE